MYVIQNEDKNTYYSSIESLIRHHTVYLSCDGDGTHITGPDDLIFPMHACLDVDPGIRFWNAKPVLATSILVNQDVFYSHFYTWLHTATWTGAMITIDKTDQAAFAYHLYRIPGGQMAGSVLVKVIRANVNSDTVKMYLLSFRLLLQGPIDKLGSHDCWWYEQEIGIYYGTMQRRFFIIGYICIIGDVILKRYFG